MHHFVKTLPQLIYYSGSQTVVRERLQGGSRIELLYVLHKKYIHSYSTCRVLLKNS